MTNQIELFTRGDDAGMNAVVNRAMADACRRGILKNVGIMAPAPSAEEACAVFRDLPGIDVGIHICFTCEWGHVRWGALTGPERARCLSRKDGSLYPDSHDIHKGPPDADQMIGEFEAQLTFLKSRGVPLSYADEHMGVGWVSEAFRDAVQDVCKREGIRYLNHPDNAGLFTKTPKADPDATNRVEAQLSWMRKAAPGRYMIVTHPAYAEGEMLEAYFIRTDPSTKGEQAIDRDWQRRQVMDTDMLTFVRDHGIAVKRFSELG